MNGTVINVSSRESSPVQEVSRRTPRSIEPRSRPKRPLPTGDVIELTDSDSDSFPANVSKLHMPHPNRSTKKAKTRSEPVAGPSRRQDAQPLAAGPALLPVRTPSTAPVAAAPVRPPSPAATLPLFLPDLDGPDAQQVVPIPPPPPPPPLQEVVPPVPHDPPHDQMPAPVPQAPPLQESRDPFDAYVVQVLEIIPDVSPTHVYSLLEQHYPSHQENVVEHVLHTLFENPGYPKADAKGKGKRKRDADDDGQEPVRAVKPKIDYGNAKRKSEGSPYYVHLAADQLISDFPDIPVAHIRETLNAHGLLYAPTFLALREHRTLKPLPYKPVTRPRPKGKGKGIQQHDDEFERELQWVRAKLEEEEAKKAEEAAEELRLQEEGGIECGCCFTEYPFDKMVQCPEAHLFCTSCMLTYAETKLGEDDARIVCMDQSGCKLPFPEGELRRFLTPTLLALYERVKQRKEIEAAGIEGLEECPFCEYKVVIENEHEKLFRCENEQCGAVTCRQCKKPDHLPRSCQEVADEKKLDVRHAIEEAMTQALMRNCPKCKKAFIKEAGCNKMSCPNCMALSCYVCRKLITGYDHFANPPPYTAKTNPNKCPLWDASVEGRHSDEVTAAAKQAVEDFKRAHPELDEKDLAVDLPPPPPAAAGPSRGGVPGPVPGRGMAHPHWARLGDIEVDFGPVLPPMPLPQAPPRGVRRAQRADLAHRVDRVRAWRRQLENAEGQEVRVERMARAADVIRAMRMHPPQANPPGQAQAVAHGHGHGHAHAYPPMPGAAQQLPQPAVFNFALHLNPDQPHAAVHVHQHLPQPALAPVPAAHHMFFPPMVHAPVHFPAVAPPPPPIPVHPPVVVPQRRSRRVEAQGRRGN
ncbi:hypothetical protein C8Q78DRAFT_986254 [Trametes maxima]|nr:hypothetical protein C8Q78DRAFT_986254 [Trametes maxima]